MMIARKVWFWVYSRPDNDDGGTGGTGGTGDNDTTKNDPENLLSALKSERAISKTNADKAAEAEAKATELQARLSELEKVDAKEYQRLIKQEKEREEQAHIQKGAWDTLKQEKDAEIEAERAEKAKINNELTQTKIDSRLESAFRNSGGLDQLPAVAGFSPVDPLELVKSYLGKSLTLEDGKVKVLDQFGKPEKDANGKDKTLEQKLAELKQSGLGHLFRATNPRSGNDTSRTRVASDGSDVKVYTREQAEKGQVDIAALASGKAEII